MTLNGAIMQLTELHENPMMPNLFKPAIQKVIETISEFDAWQYHPADEPPEDDRYVLIDIEHFSPAVGYFAGTGIGGYSNRFLNTEGEPISDILGWWELPERPEVEE